MGLVRPDADKQLDVRGIEGEPFEDILAALEDLSSDSSLLLISSFEPKPLYQVLERRGFRYEPTNPESDVWYVTITDE